MQIVKITEQVAAAARKLLQDPGLKLRRSDRDLLAAVASGKRKRIDAQWWRKIHNVVDRSKLDKLARMADPERNSNEHERAVAAAKLEAFKGRRPPGLRPEAPPIDFAEAMRKSPRWQQRHKTNPPPPAPPAKDAGVKQGGGVKQDGGAKPKHDGVKQKPKRTGDRNKDRHKPGYMRDYMREYQRRRRAKAKPASKS